MYITSALQQKNPGIPEAFLLIILGHNHLCLTFLQDKFTKIEKAITTSEPPIFLKKRLPHNGIQEYNVTKLPLFT